MDWNARVILAKFREGQLYREAAGAVGMTRHGVMRRIWKDPEFAAAVAIAREAGKEERVYRLWLRHPCRGKRPPTGRGHGGKPRFCYGRR